MVRKSALVERNIEFRLELLEELKALSLDNALSLPQVCSALKISLLNIIDMR